LSGDRSWNNSLVNFEIPGKWRSDYSVGGLSRRSVLKTRFSGHFCPENVLKMGFCVLKIGVFVLKSAFFVLKIGFLS
jgi:hypothetical protein